jgi:hypothetical protein
MTLVGATVAVWMGAEGIPEHFIWADNRYSITDTPTPLDMDYAAIIHPGEMPLGWRFQGTSDDGDTRMFDVLYDSQRGEWQLLHTYQ